MKDHTEIFENVIAANREYIASLNGGTAEAQTEALAKSNKMFNAIIAANLCTEYKDYCDVKTAKTGSIF